MPVSVPRGAMIRAGFRLLGLYGPARDYFAQMRYKPKPKFAAGLIRPVLSGPGAAAIGRMIPMIEHLTAALGSCEMEPFAAEEERQAKAV